MVIDPICCLTVDESTERRAFFNGKTVYFCSEHCREKFLSIPDADKPKSMPQGTAAHTCARHPELWQEDPCDCPKCRMAMEPATKPAETHGQWGPESHDMTVRSRIAAALILPVLRGWSAITRGHIKPPAQYILKSREGLRTTVPSA